MKCKDCTRYKDCGSALVIDIMNVCKPSGEVEIQCKDFKYKNDETKQEPINYFVEMAHLNETPAAILNWYRNCYYKEPDNTERGIVANALNSVLPELSRLRELEDKIKKIVGDFE